MSCCPAPTAPESREDAQLPPGQQRRPIVRGGGGHCAPTQHLPGLQHHQEPGRLEQALHQRCQPGTTLVLPPLLLGGGPAPAPGAPGTPPVVADPALVALVAILADGTPEAEPSLLRQLAGQLSTMLSTAGERLRTMLPSTGNDGATRGATPDAAPQLHAPRADAPGAPGAPVPLQPPAPPPPPPGPTLTLDPTSGTIVLDEPPGPGDAGTTPDLASGGTDDDAPPTSWLPIAGYRFRLRGGLGTFADRVAALLRERGITRMQLLLLTLAAPAAVTIAIAIVDAIIAGR